MLPYIFVTYSRVVFPAPVCATTIVTGYLSTAYDMLCRCFAIGKRCLCVWTLLDGPACEAAAPMSRNSSASEARSRDEPGLAVPGFQNVAAMLLVCYLVIALALRARLYAEGG